MSERDQEDERVRNQPRGGSGTGAAGFEPDQLAQRLREIAERLRSPDVDEAEAEALAREAADLVGKASSEIESDLRKARATEGP
jgi:hypothetical protein